MHKWVFTLALLACPAFAESPTPPQVLIAVASNFVDTCNALSADFKQRSNAEIKITPGSTGKLYAQISNGAPYDILLSADAVHPQRLEAENKAIARSRFTYAIGRLALYCASLEGVENGAVLKSGALKHLAIANPETAPYGAAAVETLRAMGLWESTKDRIVYGENIAQTFQFASTGAAEAGFVAYSQVISLPASRYWVVPDNNHAELRHDAVLLAPGRDNKAAVDFLAYLRSAAAQKIITASGYRAPVPYQ